VLDNLEQLGPRAVWTGPLSRGDYKVVAAHLDVLRESPEEFVQVYEALNRLAARVLAQDTPETNVEPEKALSKKRAKARVMGGNA
jgi:predicted short-subunit dehydrogenase-like oxidoreductase (DUF2520 family)